MIQELYRTEVLETSLNVTQSQIDSIRRKHIVKSGCRVYDGGLIGIAGTLGEAVQATWDEARANLDRKVPYPYPPEQGKVRHEDRREAVLDDAAFTARAEQLLARLRTAFPRIIFSNKINRTQEIQSLTNDAGLDYEARDLYYTVGLLVKDVDSVSVFDSVAEYYSRTFDVDAIFDQISQVIAAHGTPVDLPEGRSLPIIVQPGALLEPLAQALHGQLFHRNASLLSGKLGQKLFSEDFTLSASRTADMPATAFFDAEGAVLEGDACRLIDKGVLVRAYADKKTAAEFAVENTAAAAGSYDDLPQLGAPSLEIASSGKSLQALLEGRDALYIVMMSGGDCTNEGVFASPVQTAYLWRDGRLVGRLPEFSVSGSIFDLFGKDFVGRSEDKPFLGLPSLVVNAAVTR